MRIGVILCPGPSLRAGLKYPYVTAALRDDAVIICVNKARDAINSHDWWCSGDANPQSQDIEKRMDVRTREGHCGNHDMNVSWRKHLNWADLKLLPTAYTTVASIHLCAYLRCEHVLIEGHDMAGARYFDGSTGDCLNDERWDAERVMFNAALEQFKTRFAVTKVDMQDASVRSMVQA